MSNGDGLTQSDVVALGGYSGPDSTGDTTVADTGGGGGWMSGLGDIFSSVGTAITSVYRTVNPPQPTTIPQGGVIFNPKTGTYQPAVQQPSLGISSNMLLLVGAAIVVVLLLRR